MEKEQNAIWNGYNVWSPTTRVQDGGSVNESDPAVQSQRFPINQSPDSSFPFTIHRESITKPTKPTFTSPHIHIDTPGGI
ncbi:hypothetical protein I308_103941 [Cryptococcus tetragattii IND107]|uniref:Uncharacterized protein n=1 Tax=Cryptococcus tetragattii IND107 TaxID=1296105 RepID=A0ABR3BT60_9TREE